MGPSPYAVLACRGDQAAAADVSGLADAALFSSRPRHASPLAVAASSSRLGGQQMLATLLSNDQVGPGGTPGWPRQHVCIAPSAGVALCPGPSFHQTPVAPLERMLGRARRLFAARAYVHRYERHGLSCPADFEEAFDAVEGLLEGYREL